MSDPARYCAKGPELLIYMVEKAAHLLRTQGRLPADTAEDLAIALTDKMAQDWGGQLIYIPKGTWNGGALSCFELTKRDWAIFRAYKGTNRQQLCVKYQISERRLYQVVTACRRALAQNHAHPPATGSHLNPHTKT